MGLRDQAAADLVTILEDTTGFGWPITVTDPSGTTAALTGFSADIGRLIDAQTGVPVAARVISVALPIASLTATSLTKNADGLAIPAAIPDATSKPWLVAFADTAGKSYTAKVAEAHPDRTLGIVTLLLDLYHS